MSEPLTTRLDVLWDFDDGGIWRLYVDGSYGGFVRVTDAGQFKARLCDERWISASQYRDHAHFDTFAEAKARLLKVYLEARAR